MGVFLFIIFGGSVFGCRDQMVSSISSWLVSKMRDASNMVIKVLKLFQVLRIHNIFASQLKNGKLFLPRILDSLSSYSNLNTAIGNKLSIINYRTVPRILIISPADRCFKNIFKIIYFWFATDIPNNLLNICLYFYFLHNIRYDQLWSYWNANNAITWGFKSMNQSTFLISD